MKSDHYPRNLQLPTSKHQDRYRESNAPFDDDKGRRIWHQVDGKWKWYPAHNRHIPVKHYLRSMHRSLNHDTALLSRRPVGRVTQLTIAPSRLS